MDEEKVIEVTGEEKEHVPGVEEERFSPSSSFHMGQTDEEFMEDLTSCTGIEEEITKIVERKPSDRAIVEWLLGTVRSPQRVASFVSIHREYGVLHDLDLMGSSVTDQHRKLLLSKKEHLSKFLKYCKDAVLRVYSCDPEEEVMNWICKHVLKSDTQDFRYYVAIGDHFYQRKYDGAAALFYSLAGQISPSDEVLPLLRRGFMCWCAGDYVGASRDYSSAKNIQPSVETLILLAMAQMKEMVYTKALRNITMALDMVERCDLALWMGSYLQYLRGLFEGAVGPMRPLLSFAPDNMDFLMDQACAYYHAKNYDSALKNISTCLEREEKNVRALHLLSMVNLRQNKMEELKESLDRLLKECGENAWVVNDAGCMLASSCQFERSLLVLIDGAKKYPQNPHIFTNIGTILLEMGDAENSIGMFEAALRWHEDMLHALLGLGNAFRFLSRHSEAYEAYCKASVLLDRTRGHETLRDRSVWKEEPVRGAKTSKQNVAERLFRMMAFIGPTFHDHIPSVPEDRHDIPWPFRKNEHVFPFAKTLLLSQEES